MNKPKLNDDFHTKLFITGHNKDHEVYVAFNEATEEQKKQILRELDGFSKKIEKILRE